MFLMSVERVIAEYMQKNVDQAIYRQYLAK